ncbi:MAG: DUF4367 domain-containing protein [Clostridiales bacterium]|nr:DUF4367 domain-containing protein [Clostridiales bacterium]
MIGMKNDKLDAMMMMASKSLVKQNENEWLAIDDTNIEVPKSLNHKVMKMIRNEQQKKEFGKLYIIGKRVVAVFLIVCTISLAMILSVEAVREKIWETLMKWYEDHIAISNVVDSAPEIIEIKREPISVPEKWNKEVMADNNYMYALRYIMDGERILTYNQLIIDESDMLVDNKNIDIKDIQVGKHSGNLFYTDNIITLVWCDGEYNYIISTDSMIISEKELMEIANSVK